MNETILEIKDVRFSYPETPGVLEGIDIRIRRGERVALAGPNGSGKTTLFLLMCGILKPVKGSIFINQKPVKQGRFNNEIGYLFQSPDDQLFSSTIFDDVAFGPLNMGMNRETAEGAAKNALETVSSLHLADRSPHHLSGGEKRMAAIASILVMSPRIVLFDEPTSNLDSRNRRKLIETIGKMNETLIVSSHDLEFLLETCERLILMDEGKIITTGKIREIMADEDLMNRHGLEKPHSLVPHKIKHKHH